MVLEVDKLAEVQERLQTYTQSADEAEDDEGEGDE
jgi:hypothetical protein